MKDQNNYIRGKTIAAYDQNEWPAAVEQHPKSQIQTMNDFLNEIGRDKILYCHRNFWLREGKSWRKVNDLEVRQCLQRMEQSNGGEITSLFLKSVLDLLRAECFKPGDSPNEN